MYRRLSPILFLLIFIRPGVFAAVFVVTSNADSGPGTLREALTLAAANGSVAKDYINFNLPDLSEAGRTITIASNLPELSPELVIDGTTQPGLNFGITGSKVKIANIELNGIASSMDIFGGSNLGEITIKGFWINTVFGESTYNPLIKLSLCNSIDIEQCLIEKGEVEIDDSQKFVFQKNIAGFLPDGVNGTYPDGVYGFVSSITANNVVNTIIGGDVSQGNLIAGGIRILNYSMPVEWNFIISNNKMGTDFTGVSSSLRLNSLGGRIKVEAEAPGLKAMHGVINDNLLVNFGGTGIFVSGPGDVVIKGNYIGTNKDGLSYMQDMPDYVQAGFPSTAIDLEVGINANVGGSNTGDANIIGYVTNGVLEQLADHVTITQNSIFCLLMDYFNAHDIIAYEKALPFVKIINTTGTAIYGTATPGARVELFSDEDGSCKGCFPRHFFAAVTADGQGKWSYMGSFPSSVIASSIYNNQTSKFTRAEVDISNLQIIQPHCGDNTGTIKGLKFYNATLIKWVDQNDNVISTSLDINNLPPGKYKLKVGSAICGAESDWIQIVDNSIKIDNSQIKINQPSCNLNGSISGLQVSAYQNENYDCVWKDQNSNQVATTLTASDLTSGAYTLTVTGKLTGCSKTYGPILLVSSPTPTLNQTSAVVLPSACGQSTGSIRGITATGTGTLKYIWWNVAQQQVGTSVDLLNQSAGIYKLQVTDDTQCGPIYTTAITIPEVNGITLDETHVQATIASCGASTGSITGIQAAGAGKYVWTDAGGHTLITTTPDLLNAPAGNYTLTASNSYGCIKQSQTYTINLQAPTQFPAYPVTITSACYNSNNGAAAINIDALVKSVRWVNSANLGVGSTPQLSNAAAGDYQLYLTDQNGCERFYKTYTVTSYPDFQLANAAQPVDDQCDLGTGSVEATTVTGGAPPYTYAWFNASGVQIAAGNGLTNLKAGVYKLKINDNGCGSIEVDYTIAEHSDMLSPPEVSDLQLCSSGKALLKVNNPMAGLSYRLYDSQNSQQPLDEQAAGIFNVNVTGNRSFYVSEISGSCESPRAELKVSVGLSAANIANSFTPNGDGINDMWNIASITNYADAVIQVFTRYGQKVFESKGYSHPFDGTYGGSKLPAGVYYYIINLKTSCNLLSGSLTIIR